MKRIHRGMALALSAVLLLLTAAPSAWAAENTITIETAQDLAELSKNCSLDSWSQGKTVLLAGDIDLTGTDFRPIPTFGGTFDGQGHTISGLLVTGPVPLCAGGRCRPGPECAGNSLSHRFSGHCRRYRRQQPWAAFALHISGDCQG